MKILIYILLWLLINTWVSVWIMVKGCRVGITDTTDTKVLALCAIFTYPGLMFIYRTTKHIKRRWNK